MRNKKVKFGLAALVIVAAGYMAAELSYQKEKQKRKLPHLGDKKDFKEYQNRFMDVDGKPIMDWRYCHFYGCNDTLATHTLNSIRTKAYKLKYTNAPTENTDDNLLFGTFESQNIGLSLNYMKANRNTNVLTIGRNAIDRGNYIRTNIMQENSSAVIVDPNGDLYCNLAPHLISKGYNVYLFALGDLQHSNHYNPLDHVYDADGNISISKVGAIIDLYMAYIRQGKGEGDPFWNKCERAFISALVYYVLENDDIPKVDKCFNTVLKKVQMVKTEEDGEVSPLTIEIEEWLNKQESEGCSCCTKVQYETFQTAPIKTQNAIFINTLVNLQIFSVEYVDKATRTNIDYPETNIDFKKIASQQSYLFLGIPNSHKAYDFLISLLYSQMYHELYECGERTFRGKYHIGYREGLPVFDCFNSLTDAMNFKKQVSDKNIVEHEYGKSDSKVYDLMWTDIYGDTRSYKTCLDREALVTFANSLDKMVIWSEDVYGHGSPALPVHVNVYLNDFVNCGYIPNFLNILSIARRYRIGNHCLINSVEELKKLYTEDEHFIALATVDTVIYFGSDNQPSADIKLIQEMIGQTTIKSNDLSQVQLMSAEDINAIGNIDAVGNKDNHEIVMIRDCVPYVCQKFNPRNHKRYEDFRMAATHRLSRE